MQMILHSKGTKKFMVKGPCAALLMKWGGPLIEYLPWASHHCKLLFITIYYVFTYHLLIYII